MIALMSGFNAFLNLKSRYRDWRGTKSRKGFEKRLGQLKGEFEVIATFKQNISGYFVWTLDAAVTPLKSFGLAFMLLLIAFLVPGDFLRMLFVLIALLITTFGAGAAMHLFRIIRFVAMPADLVQEIIEFVKNAKDKGVTSSEGEEFIFAITQASFFTKEEKELIYARLVRPFPHIAADLVGD
jgi:hypothetical protein